MRREDVVFLRPANFNRRPPDERAPEPSLAAVRAEFNVRNRPLRAAQAEINEIDGERVPAALLRQRACPEIFRAILRARRRFRVLCPMRLDDVRLVAGVSGIHGRDSEPDAGRRRVVRKINFLHQRPVHGQQRREDAERAVRGLAVDGRRVMQAGGLAGVGIRLRRRPLPIFGRAKIRRKRIVNDRGFGRHFGIRLPLRHPFQHQDALREFGLPRRIGGLRVTLPQEAQQRFFRHLRRIEDAALLEIGGEAVGRGLRPTEAHKGA